MANLVTPLRRLGRGPHQHQHLDHWTDRLKLRNDEDAGALVARVEAIPEVTGHGTAVMRDEDAVLPGGYLEHSRVSHSGDSPFRCRRKVDGALTAADGQDDIVIKVSVGLEPD